MLLGTINPVQAAGRVSVEPVSPVVDDPVLAVPPEIGDQSPPDEVDNRPLLAPLATVTHSGPSKLMLNSDFSFTVTFDNTSAETGYGPFIDIYFPASQGITFTSASYLGEPLTAVELTHQTFVDNDEDDDPVTPDDPLLGKLKHPLGYKRDGYKHAIVGTVGDTLLTIEMPIGSYSPDAPVLEVTINASMSDAAYGVTPTIYTRGGYQYGSTPLDDPCCDPTIFTPWIPDGSDPTQNASPSYPNTWNIYPITPTVIGLSKSMAGSRLTGPNYTFPVTLSVDIADGQTVNDLVLLDQLPSGLEYLGITSITGGCTATQEPLSTLAQTSSADAVLEITCAGGITGGSGGNDVQITYNVFIPEFKAAWDGGGAILSTTTGTGAALSNNVQLTGGTWGVENIVDVCDPCSGSRSVTPRAITLGKGVSGTAAAGAVLDYTLTINISDYFTFADFVITDVISDGQHFYGTNTPTFSASDRHQTVASANFSFANNIYNVGDTVPGTPASGETLIVDQTQISSPADYVNSNGTDGTTTLKFFGGDLLAAQGGNDYLMGGDVNGSLPIDTADAGTANATIIYSTQVQQEFNDNYIGDPSIDQGDLLSNSASLSAEIRSNATPALGVGTGTGSDGAGVSIQRGTFTKNIYAVNGVVVADPNGKPQISSGETITYRLQYVMPSADFQDMYVTDFFPSPFFQANNHNGDGTSGDVWSFNATKLPGSPSPGDAVPVVTGEVRVGPNDTTDTLTVPGFSYNGGIVVDAGNNSIDINIGSYDDQSASPSAATIDLLVTVTASADPFADGLYLTNVAKLRQGSTNAGDQTSSANQQVITSMPDMVGKKGIVSTDNAGATLNPVGSGNFVDPGNDPASGAPFGTAITSPTGEANSNITDVDAGDLVKFAIILKNSGSADTYDIKFSDLIPAIYQIPTGGYGLNLQIYRGDKTELQWRNADGTTPADGEEIFQDGIELLDKTDIGGEPHPCQRDTGDGTDIVVITYDLEVRADADPSEAEPNSFTLDNYSGSDGGDNFVPDPQKDDEKDDSTTTLKSPTMSKARLSADTAQIGELVQYTVTIDLTEGMMTDASIIDVLTAGLAHAQVDSVTRSSANVTVSSIASWTGNTADSFPAPVYSEEPSGSVNDEDVARKMTLSLGTITNDQRDNTTQETLTVTYSAVVINSTANNRGSTFNNTATLNWQKGTGTGELTDTTLDVTVIEPTLKVTKSVAPVEGDASDVVTYTLRVEHDATSDATAYDLNLSDVLPAELSYVAATLDCAAAGTTVTTDTCAFAGDTLTATWTDLGGFPTGSVTVITFNAQLAAGVQPAQLVNNEATLTWTSRPGNPGQQGTNTLGTERTGDETPVQDDYTTNSDVDVTIKQPSVNKSLTSTDQTHTSGSDVVVGEIITYQTAIQAPEGVTQNVTLVDLLDVGLAFVDVVSVTADAGIETDIADPGVTYSADFTPVQTGALIEADGVGPVNEGRKLTMAFSNVRNTNSDNVARYITVTYRAVALNSAGNNAGVSLDNTATWSWEVSGSPHSVSNSTTVTLREPVLNITKTVTNGTNVDAGNTATFTLSLESTGSYTAFDVEVSDVIPAGLTYVNGTITCTPTGGGLLAASTCTESGGTISATWSGAGNPFPSGATATITFDVTVDSNVETGDTITNTANMEWTSIAGAPGQRSTHNTLAYERTGDTTDPGTVSNDYKDSDSADVTIQAPLNQGKSIFATNQTHTSGTDVAIGEIVTYEVTMQVPEGVTKTVTLTDELDQGLAFVDVTLVTSSNVTDVTWTGTPNSPTIEELPGGSAAAQDQARRMVMDFGDITNTNTNDVVTETVTVRYRVVVLNNAGNDEGDTLSNLATWRWTVGGTPSTVTKSTTVTVREPVLTVAKVVTSGAAADAGDPISFEITINNNTGGTIPALDVILTDTLPSELDYDAGLDCSTVSGGLAVPDVCNMAGDVLTVEWQGVTNPFLVGGQAVITFDARVNASAVVGQTITNNATVTWTSLDGDVSAAQTANNTLSDERNSNDNSGTTPQDDYTVTDGANVSLNSPANPGKEIAATNQTHTSGDDSTTDPVINVAIGERVTYEVNLQFPEGTTQTVNFTDVVGQGLAVVPGSISINANANLSTTIAGGFPAVVANATISDESAAAVDKQRRLVLDFGNVTNGDNSNGTQEFVVVRYDAVVLNSSGNTEGVSLQNQAQWTWSGGSSAVSSQTVVVREPNLGISKSITSGTPGDAGDTVHYQITVSHTDLTADEIAAQDVSVTDALPAGLIYSANLTCSGTATTCNHSAGVITAVWSSLAPGSSVTIDFDALITNSAVVGTTITNTANLEYTSASGDITTPQTGNTLSVERTGNAANPGDSNPHNGSDTADLLINDPAMSKTIGALSQSPIGVNPSSPEIEDAVIGEQVTFTITVTLPEGVTPDLIITDTMPLTPGFLEVASATVTTMGANMTPATPPTAVISDTLPVTPDGIDDTAVFNFGTITNAADGNTSNDNIVIQVVALVINSADNQDGDLLTNTVEMDVDTGRITDTDTAQVHVVEPLLDVSKTSSVIAPPSAAAVMGATVEYTITVANPNATSNAAAYHVVVTDTIPTGMTYVPSSITTQAGWTADDSAAPVLTWTLTGGTSLALDASLNFTYRVSINQPPNPDLPDVTDPVARILHNQVETEWESLATPDGNERTGDDNSGSDPQNDYTSTVDVGLEVTHPDLTVSKDHGTDLFTPNGTITFVITYTNDGSRDANSVVVTETVPAYSTFDETSSGGPGIWSCANNSPAGTVCTHTIGTLAAGASGTVDFAVTVYSSIPAGVTTLDNTVSIDYDQANDGVEPTPTDNSDTDTVPSTAFAPDLVVTKDDSRTAVMDEEVLVYAITYQNTGNQHAAGVELTDDVPDGTVFDAANSTSGWSCSDGDAAGTSCVYTIGDLLSTDPVQTIYYAVRVLDAASLQSGNVYQILNTVTIADDGTANPDSNPSNNTATDADQIIGTLDKELVAIDEPALTAPIPAGSEVVIGSTLTYRITAHINPAVAPYAPPLTFNDVTVVDTLPAGLAFRDCVSITPSGAAGDLTSSLGDISTLCSPNPADPPNGNPAIEPLPAGSPNPPDQGRKVTFKLGTLSNNTASVQTITIVYRVVVLDVASNVRGVLLDNNVYWDVSGLQSPSVEAVAVSIIEPDLNISKKVMGDQVVGIGEPVTFRLHVFHIPSSNSNGYETIVWDPMPNGLGYVPGSLRHISGLAPDTMDAVILNGRETLKITWANFSLGSESEIEFDARVLFYPPNNVIENVTNVEWTSMAGDLLTSPISDFNQQAIERWYDPADPANIRGGEDYTDANGDHMGIDDMVIALTFDDLLRYWGMWSPGGGGSNLPETGFAPNVVTPLVDQPPVSYQDMGGLWMEIPRLNLKLSIVGVPFDQDVGWDVSWLGSQAGYLEGTSYPTSEGNSFITAHVYDNLGRPGPFVNLNQLAYGDEIIVHSNGERYVYQMLEGKQVEPNDLFFLFFKDNYSRITLLTCQGYDEATDSYQARYVVQAILVSQGED